MPHNSLEQRSCSWTHIPATGSKRGVDTRVSLKQALAAQGFKGGTKGDTEWSQWMRSEKEQLSNLMERHEIEREDKGTHDKHLSVLDYKELWNQI